jgi:hypothetical protein
MDSNIPYEPATEEDIKAMQGFDVPKEDVDLIDSLPLPNLYMSPWTDMTFTAPHPPASLHRGLTSLERMSQDEAIAEILRLRKKNKQQKKALRDLNAAHLKTLYDYTGVLQRAVNAGKVIAGLKGDLERALQHLSKKQ